MLAVIDMFGPSTAVCLLGEASSRVATIVTSANNAGHGGSLHHATATTAFSAPLYSQPLSYTLLELDPTIEYMIPAERHVF